MTSNLYPISHYTNFVVDRARFLYAMIQEIPIEFGSHVCWVIIENFQTTNYHASLPFGDLITRLAHHKQVPISSIESCKKPMSAFARKTHRCNQAHISQRPF